MRGPDLLPLAEAERTDLHALLRELTPQQWQVASLCEGWNVRDVAVHVVSFDVLTPAALAGAVLRAGGRIAQVNQRVLGRHDALSTDDVVELVGRCLRPRGLTTGFRGAIALTDATIHHQDIRRALGLDRTIPEERLHTVLDFALIAPPLPARSHARDLRFTATDIDWSTGSGPEVSGPGEAIMMALAGRSAALDDLSGNGLAALRSRVSG